MKIDKKNPNWEERDRFILSKGHACLAYYAALCEVGYISKEELKTFEKNDTNLLGHPVINRKFRNRFFKWFSWNGSFSWNRSCNIIKKKEKKF